MRNMTELSSNGSLQRYGPGEGDRIHLADTGLIIEVERSLVPRGSESLIGAGKNLRDGMHVIPGTHPEGLDAVITNVVVLDPIVGTVKADIGIRNGDVAGLGNAGNPDVMEVTEGLVIDSTTSIIQAKGLIATAGGIDTHQHFKSPEVLSTALHSGITSVIQMGHAPNYQARTDPQYLRDAIRSSEMYPVNIGFLGQGSDSDRGTIRDAIESGMCGLKIHEDHGAYPAVIKAAFDVAEEYDVPVSIHTDSINESGTLDATMAAIDGRPVHAFHIEGSGGGHIPDLLELVGCSNVLASSTNPTIPHTEKTRYELMEMILAVHQMEGELTEDEAFATARVRDSTMAAEERLHEIGAISMTSSDSMGMGRAAETILSTWQTASKMKYLEEEDSLDNERVRRYLAKYTINPAIAQGIDQYVGSLESGKMADIVLWQPKHFGAKPERVLKSGVVVSAPVGSENGTTTTGQPTEYDLSVGGVGAAPGPLSALFTSEHAAQNPDDTPIDTTRKILPVRGAQSVTKADMVENTATPNVDIDPETREVTIDGSTVSEQPLERSTLSQRYFLH